MVVKMAEQGSRGTSRACVYVCAVVVMLLCCLLAPVTSAASARSARVAQREDAAVSSDPAASSSSSSSSSSSHHFMDVLMKGAKPNYSDAYLCTGYEVQEDEAYIVKFEAQAFADTVHHILVYGCEGEAASTNDFWNCPGMCKGGREKIMFAWAKNAPPTQLPDGVGMKIGKKSSVKTIVMQIHYAKAFKAADTPDKSGIRLHLSSQEQRYAAGVFLLMSYNFAVPPNQPKYHVDISCTFRKNFFMVPFAYRTHAHSLGSVITGYQHNTTGYHLIGKGNPQWPQAFYPTNSSVVVKPGDSLVARCTYNSMSMSHSVNVGATGNDEMCNFYIMFYTNASVADPSGQCGMVESQDLVDHMPADSDVTLPPRPLLEAEAHGHHHAHHHNHNPMTGGSSSSSEPSEASHSDSTDGGVETIKPLTGQLQYQSHWPSGDLDPGIGQVGGVATDSQGRVYIFHRGERVWDQTSFDRNNNFQQRDHPIQQDTVVVLSPDGQLVRKFGAGQYFMPHGISVDHEGNIWLTDVALHQVFRIPAGGTEPDLTLGERFIHGSDDHHLCKPTDVAVMPSGDFFVSDGYCNSRILKFSKDGRLLKQWGQFGAGEVGPGQFYIPHSVTVAPELQLVCVADRENGRIQCFDLDGNFQFFLKHEKFGSALYAVEFCPRHGGLLFAVNGGDSSDIQGFTFSLRNKTLLETWNMPAPLKLSSPHDVAVDVAGHAVYVGELRPPAVRKFLRGKIGDITTTAPTTTTTTNTTKRTTAAGLAVSGIEESNSANLIDSGKDSEHKDAAKDTLQSDREKTDNAAGPSLIKSEAAGEEETGGKGKVTKLLPLILVGPLVALPMVVLMVFFLVRQFRGPSGLCSGSNASTKGFDPLLQNLSEDSDSENEMFMQPTTGNKTKKTAPF